MDNYTHILNGQDAIRHFCKMLARLIPREIDADVNAGTNFFKCLREIEARRAKHEK
jgi:hypothetical protein